MLRPSAAVRRACLLLASLLLLAGVAAPAYADGTPNLALSGGPAASVLYGTPVPVHLTASLPAGAPKGYNLAFRVVLPAGARYVGGSAGAIDGEPTQITDPLSGKTTLIWSNVDDLVASSSHTLSFSVAYNDTSSTGTPTYDVGDTLSIDSAAYISTDPRDQTAFSGTGQAVAGPDSYTGSATQTTTTTLSAIQVVTSEPHTDGKLLRGLHDQQTVYSLTVTNNAVNPTNGVSLEEYLPAGLEFLGCAGTPDDTTATSTNPGSTDEYSGSGPMTVAHPTAAEGCVPPDLVETVNVDPDGSGPLPAGVYTHVTWNSLGTFAKGQTETIRFAAAVPLRENTMTWNAAGGLGTGLAPAVTGAQTANLDNNNGPETYDGEPVNTYALVAGAYQAPNEPALPVTDTDTLQRTAKDLVIQKSNDTAALTQGDITRWTVDVAVSEYRTNSNLVINDTLPNGLCPLGPVNETTGNSPSDSECDPVAGKSPSLPYTTATEQADGTYAITWTAASTPSLADIPANGTRQLTFSSRTRSHYQANFADADPIRAGDSARNAINAQGNDWVVVGADGQKIWHEQVDGALVSDDSGSGKSATGPGMLEQVAATYPSDGNCANLAAANYGKTLPTYGPGDQVCWKLQLTFPQGLNTASQDVYDILPAGVDYVPGSWVATTNNNVAIGSFDVTPEGRLHWTIGAGGTDVQPGQTFEVVFKSTVGSPTGHASGDVEGSLMKFSYVNTAGKAFTLRDRADFTLALPQLGLVKGIRQINAAGPVYGPNVDHKQVAGGDAVQFRIDVTNSGNADATGTRVWDLLPTGIACTDVSAISDGGTCNALAGRIEWGGLAVPAGPANAKTLTYTVTVPTGVSPDQSFVNTAGVVEYAYTTNDGRSYPLIPANTVVTDPSLPAANAPAAEDVSDIYTARATVVKTRTTSVTESGNANGQATIGEVVNYKVTTTIPKGTTLYGTPTVVDVLGARQTLVPGSLCATACTLDGATLPAAGVSVAESPANTITATFPATYANTTGHDVALVLTFSAKVLDVPANTRGTSLPNTAKLTFQDQLGRPQADQGSVSTTIVEPKLALTKSHAQPGRISPGQLVDVTVKASNSSATNVSTAHGVTVVDTLPAGTDPVDASGTPIADGGTVPAQGGTWNAANRTITWNPTTTPALAAVAPGAAVSLTYKVRVASPSVVGQTYVNQADATTTSLDGTVSGIRTPASTASTAGDYKAHAQDTLSVALPAVSKSVTPDPVTIGNQVTWHVAVTIPKNLQSFDTTVVDTVPDGFAVDAYGAATCVSGCLPGDPTIATLTPAAGAAGALTAAWYLGDLAPATADRVYDLVLTGHLLDGYRTGGAKVLNGQTLTNSVVVKTNRTDKVTTNPTSVPAAFDDTTAPATAASHVVEPKLTIDKSVSVGDNAYVEGGQHLTYTVTVTNTGTSPAYDADVTDQPDSQLEDVVNGTLPAGVTATKTWTAADRTMSWHLTGPIAPGASVALTYTADVVSATVPSALHSGDTIDNTATVGHYYGVPKATFAATPGQYRDYTGPSDSVHLNVALPSLSIVKTPDNGSATAGAPSSFTIVVKNTDAHATAHHVVVHDAYDAGLTYAPGSATAAPAAGFAETGADASARTIDWALGSLAPGASVTITVPMGVAANVAQNTLLVNHATTQADEVAPTSDDGSLKVATKADLQVTKTSDHDPVVPGTTILYTMVTTNNGPSDAQNSTLVDTLPSYLTFVSVDDPTECAVAGRTITCSFGTLVPGASRTIHVTATLDPSQTAPITNAVDVTTTTTDTNPTNNHAEAPNTVKPTADVSIHKSADRGVYQGGDTVTYTLLAHNNGPSDAANVTIDDPLPSNLTPVSAGPGCTITAQQVHCAVGTLAPGADATVTVVTKAKGAPPVASTPDATTPKITVSKVEDYESLAPGETKTIDVTCAANGYAADGTVQIVSIDQGTGTPADVEIQQASSIAPDTYRFVVTNHATGQAQIRPHVTCLPHDTDAGADTHPLDVGPLQSQTSGTLAPGVHEITLPVSAAHHAVAQGIEVRSGRARLIGSEPVTGGWRFTVDVDQAAQVTLSLRELSDTTAPAGDPAHVHPFTFQHIVRTVTIPPGPSTQLRVSCPVGYEGIVGTYDLPEGVIPTGSVPEPVNRDVDLDNTTSQNQQVMLDLECISVQTGPPLVVETVVNTATVATTTFDPNPADDTSSVTIGIERAPGPIDPDPATTTPDAPAPAPADPAPAAPAPAAPAPAAPAPAAPAPAAPAPAAPAPAAPAPALRTATLSFGTVNVAATGATAALPITCSGTGTCTGTVALSATASSSGRATSAPAKQVVIGTATYRAAPGTTVTVTVTIAKRYRTLAKSGKLRSVTVTAGKTKATKQVVVGKKNVVVKKRASQR